MTFRRTFVGLALVFMVVRLFYIVSPWVAAFVRYQRLSRYIKIRTDHPGCVPENRAPESLKCECEFILESVRTPAELAFDGLSLHESYEPKNRTLLVSGIGTIRSGFNRIVFSSDRISINGTELPTDRNSSSFHVVIGLDGKLTNTYIDISY